MHPTQQSQSASPPIRVLCVDDAEDVCEMIGRCIALESDMQVVGSLRSADRLLEEVDQRSADVVILDLSMPGKDPLEALHELMAGTTGAQVITFSGRDDAGTREKAIRAGAAEHLSKDGDIPTLLGAIRRAARGAPTIQRR